MKRNIKRGDRVIYKGEVYPVVVVDYSMAFLPEQGWVYVWELEYTKRKSPRKSLRKIRDHRVFVNTKRKTIQIGCQKFTLRQFKKHVNNILKEFK